MNVRSSAGQLTGQFVADVLAPGQSVTGDLSVRHLDLAPLLNDPAQKSDSPPTRASTSRRVVVRTSIRCAARWPLDSPRVVAAGYAAGPIHAKARIEGRRVALDGSAAAYGAAATARAT